MPTSAARHCWVVKRLRERVYQVLVSLAGAGHRRLKTPEADELENK